MGSMMLRALVLLLMLMNVGYLAWGQGWLLPYGFGPATQREPQRLARQIKPEAIQILKSEDLSQPLPEGKSSSAECLQSEVLSAAQVDKLRPVLQGALPAQAWTLDEFVTTERWIVYMGKYPSSADLDKKRSELVKLGINPEAPRSPTLLPGLSLGAFELQTQADAALKVMSERGVHPARVVQDTPAQPGFRLRLPAVDDTLKSQLPAVRAALPTQALQPCATASAPG
jgi:hypothetical protein